VPPTFTPRPRRDHVADALSAGRLGLFAMLYFVMSAAAPLTVVVGIISTAFAVTGITGLPIAFLVVGAALVLFSVGYVAMARRMASAGAFYTFVSRGMGRPAGVGAAWVALITYNLLQVALYGGIGAAAGPLLEKAGIDVPWWLIAMLCWSVVGIMGLLRIDLSGRVLAALLTGEVAVILLTDLAGLFNPSAGDLALAEAFSPAALVAPGVGAAIIIATLGFVGFESSVVFSEESKNPPKTIAIVTYSTVAGIAGLYALSAWAMLAVVGPERIVTLARETGADLFFVIASVNLPTAIVAIAMVLFVTGIFAAALAVHNTTARYFFALGRERILPRVLGRTHPRTGAPAIGSITQSVIAFVVIAVFAVGDLDPLVGLFYGLGTLGAFGILVLATATSVAIMAYSGRHGGLTPARWVAALASAAILIAMLGLALGHIPTLLGVAADSPLGWIVPSTFAAAAAGGLVCGLVLRRVRPDLYQQIGYGATAPMSSH
jgi:amino acid transporter